MRFLLIFIGLFSVSLSSPLLAQDKQELLDKVAQYYGADMLLDAQTIRMEDDVRQFYDDYDYSPDFHELTVQRRNFVFDFAGRQVSAEYLTKIGASQFHAHFILRDAKHTITDFGNATYRDLGEASLEAEYGGAIRVSDLLLARELLTRPDEATVSGEQMWLGTWHSVFALSGSGEGPIMNILVDPKSGRISKMHRTIGEILVSYTFDRPVTKDGMSYASEYSVFIQDELSSFGLNRKYFLDAEFDRDAFDIHPGSRPEPLRVDQSAMTVQAIGNGIYHIGQGEAYTTIFQTEGGLVLFGVRAGVSDRIAAFRNESGISDPIAHAVAADHHRMEIAGAQEALATGAKLWLTPGALARLAPQFQAELAAGRLESVDSDMSLNGLQLLSFPSAHSSANLALFDPANAVISQVYHYGNPYENEPFFAVALAPSFNDAISRRSVQPRILLSGAHRKPVPWEEFLYVVAQYKGLQCPASRRICSG